ncbi:MAG: VOC family protein [Paracoccaceae bacterium]
MLTFDHLAITAETLEDGVAAVESALGVELAPGGKHPHMGTHNRLLGLGDLYMEIIATDPGAPRPDWPLWFDMDNFRGAPRITNWICRSDDLAADVAASGPGFTGIPTPLSRGDLRWQFAIPPSGKLPFDDAFPALMQWEGTLHPANLLPDRGVRLARLEIAHPLAEALRDALAGRIDEARVVIVPGPEKAMRGTFDTPHGPRVIG